MADIDPLTGSIERLQNAVSGPATAAAPEAAVDVGADGTLRAIRLTDYGRRIDPDTLVEAIVRLHAAALADARRSVADAVTRLENDPRLLAQREHLVDTFARPAPSPPESHLRREPTPEEDEEMDQYYQRRSWLE
ncbi:hypothetical protein [Nocardia thraciensis]